VTEQPRDWDKELANIDRVLAKQSGPAPPVAPGRPAATPVTIPTPGRRRSVALTWFWVVLGLAVAVALLLWPYEKACGFHLIFFLVAIGITAVVGVLAALASWSHRRAFAHVLSLLIVGWAAALAAREVLPRIGYAKQSSTWVCSAEPAPRQPAAPRAP
jgi:apolipoprotein N-acyltransferase